MLAEALGAELAAVYGVVGIAARRDGLAVLDADQHAAADGAVAAGGLHPRVRHARLGDIAVAAVLAVGVARLRGVDPGHAPKFVEESHADLVRTKVRAMLSGTTETKKR